MSINGLRELDNQLKRGMKKMNIKEHILLIDFVKKKYPDTWEKFNIVQIWSDEEEGKDQMWASYLTDEFWIYVYIKQDYNEKYSFDISETHRTKDEIPKETYLQKLEGIALSLIGCDDGGDIKYIIRDAEEIMKENDPTYPESKTDGVLKW